MSVLSKPAIKPRRKDNQSDESGILKQLSSLMDKSFDPKTTTPLEVAKFMYFWRRKRDAVMGAELFGEPATDILLALYIADACKGEFRVTEAIKASASPATTALRYITSLESKGLLSRSADRNDARVFHLHLTKKGRRMLAAVLAI